MKKIGVKLTAALVSVAVIVLLVLLGPAQAFISGFSVLDNDVNYGDNVNFQFTAQVEQGELLDINSFTLFLTGAETRSCVFDVNGTVISGCEGIHIVRTAAPDFQFGYGYGYQQGFLPGMFNFSLTLNSSLFNPGKYHSRFITTIGESHRNSAQKDFTINGINNFANGCSVRAKDGITTFNGSIFGDNNKFSINIPLKQANGGQGSFESQEKDRISYKFKVLQATKLDNNNFVFNVNGQLRTPHKTTEGVSATITMNKTSGKISFSDSIISVSNMNINFIKGC